MKKYLFSFGLLGLIAISIAMYMYNKPHKDIRSSQTDFKVEAVQLFAEFEENETNANSKYLDKLIEIKGKVRETSSDENGNVSVILESENELSGVVCQLDNLVTHKKTTFNPGEEITFKGLCTGMLMDVVMVRCVEVEN